MADKKISQLPSSTTPLNGAEILPIVQSGGTVSVSVKDLTIGRLVSAATLVVGAETQGTIGGRIEGVGTGAQLSAMYSTDNTASSLSGYNTSVSSEAVQNYNITHGANRTASRFGVTLGGYVEYSSTGSSNHGMVVGTQTNTPLILGTNNNNRVEISAAGDCAVKTGNIVQGTAAKGFNFTANTPAAGMTSQLLNWYEEGTWTPTFSTDGTDFSTLTFTVQNGRYTRIGRTVFLEVNVRVNAVSGGTGNLYVTTLPFTSTATYNDCGISIGLALGWASASAPAAGGVQASSTKIALYKDLAGTTCTAASLAAGCYFRFGTTYICA